MVALLAEGVRQQIDAGEELISFIGDPARFATLATSERLAAIPRPGCVGWIRSAT